MLAANLRASRPRELRDQEGVRRVALQSAGGWDAACAVVQPGAAGCPVPDAAVARYRSAVRADWYLVAGYVLAGAGVFGLGALFLCGSGARRVSRWCLGGVALAGAADAMENLALLRGLATLGQGQGGDGPFALAASLAVLKFAVGGPLLPAFVVVGSVLLARRVLGTTRVRRTDARPPESEDPKIVQAGQRDPEPERPPDIILPPAVADASTATLSATVGHSGPDVQRDLDLKQEAGENGKAAGGPPRPVLPDPVPSRWRNAGRVPPGRPPAEVGICASGGGIRSASVTLGRSRRSRPRSSPAPATWCRCRAAGT